VRRQVAGASTHPLRNVHLNYFVSLVIPSLAAFRFGLILSRGAHLLAVWWSLKWRTGPPALPPVLTPDTKLEAEQSTQTQ